MQLRGSDGRVGAPRWRWPLPDPNARWRLAAGLALASTQKACLRGSPLASGRRSSGSPARPARTGALTCQASEAKAKVNKVVLAYSGGLDTSVILKWLQQEYDCEVVTFTADLGQVGAADPPWAARAAAA